MNGAEDRNASSYEEQISTVWSGIVISVYLALNIV